MTHKVVDVTSANFSKTKICDFIHTNSQFQKKILYKILECNRDNQAIQQFMGIAFVSVSLSYSSTDIRNVKVCYKVKVSQMHCYFMTIYISIKLNHKQLTNQSRTAQPFIRSCSKSSLAFYRTERFISVLIRTHCWSLS